MRKCLFFVLILGFLPIATKAQLGGESSFAFLKIPVSPLATALGGVGISDESSLGMAFQNPALFTQNLHQQFEISYQKYLSDIQFTQLGYAHQWNPKWMLAWDMSYMNYGSFVGADETSELTGNFSVSEYRIGMHTSYILNSAWTLGASLHLIYGQYERYKAMAMSTTWALAYRNSEFGVRSALAFKHLGSLLYSDANSGDKLPFEIEWSCVKKLEKAPFAFSFSLNDLQSWSLYHSPATEQDPLLGEAKQESHWERAGKELMSHIALGVELRPSESFGVMGGYNFRKKNQLGVDAQSEMIGFSMGILVKIKAVEFQYAWAPMHIAGSVHHIGLAFKLTK